MPSFTYSTNCPPRAALRKCEGENNQMNTQTLSFTDADLIAPAQKFLSSPTHEMETYLLRELHLALIFAKFAPLVGAVVEYGCVEHNVVHVFYDMGQACLEICPNTGKVTEVL